MIRVANQSNYKRNRTTILPTLVLQISPLKSSRRPILPFPRRPFYLSFFDYTITSLENVSTYKRRKTTILTFLLALPAWRILRISSLNRSKRKTLLPFRQFSQREMSYESVHFQKRHFPISVTSIEPISLFFFLGSLPIIRVFGMDIDPSGDARQPSEHPLVYR